MKMKISIVLAVVFLLAGFAHANYIEFNGDMETGGGLGVPPSGVEWNGAGTINVSSDVPVGGGSQSIVSTTSSILTFWAVGLTENTDYIFEFDWKGSGVVANVYAYPGANWIEVQRNVFWSAYTDFLAGNIPDPETNWTHATAYGLGVGVPTAYGPDPWILSTGAGQNTLKITLGVVPGTVYLDNVTLSEVPEPATMILLGLGAALLRRKK
jgi:hypothetical protein